MFIFKDTLKRANIYAAYVDSSGTQYPRPPAELLTEIPDPVRGDDNLVYNQEVDAPPYLIVTPKSQAQIDAYNAAVAQVTADTQAQTDAKADTTINYLVTHTPQQCYNKVQTDVTDLASAKVMLGRFAMALSVLARKELR